MSLPPLPNPILARGEFSSAVTTLQSLLSSQGFYTGRIDQDFGPKTENGLRYFQQTHLGPDKAFLKVTGRVDRDTWWALHNPSGTPQKSNLTPRIPSGISALRKSLLEAWKAEWELKVAEDPDGSNWGARISEYLKGVGAAAWCCFSASWIHKKVMGNWPMGARFGLVKAMWNKAKELGLARDKANYVPLPGDWFVILTRNSNGQPTGQGHTGVVVSVAPDGKSFNTFAGNEGNRLKYGVRQMSQSDLVGFVQMLPVDGSEKAERILVEAGLVEREGTR